MDFVLVAVTTMSMPQEALVSILEQPKRFIIVYHLRFLVSRGRIRMWCYTRSLLGNNSHRLRQRYRVFAFYWHSIRRRYKACRFEREQVQRVL